MNILVTICARGGSKGLPKKNIIPIDGKPLIGYTIEIAKKILLNHNVKIELSTDCSDIKKVAEEFGLISSYKRPKYLADDKTGKLDVIKHLLEFSEKKHKIIFDRVLDLDVSSPLRTVKDIEESFQKLNNNADAINIFSVNKSHRNPYFNMVEKKRNGFFDLVKKIKSSPLSRQIAPNVYDLNASIYWYKRVFFECNYKTAITNKSIIYEMDHICFDVDSAEDLFFLECLFEKKITSII